MGTQCHAPLPEAGELTTVSKYSFARVSGFVQSREEAFTERTYMGAALNL